MASSPITSWHIDDETMETVRHLILGGSKITAYGDFSHEIKRHLFLGRKAMINLAAAAKSLQLCPTLCNPMDCSLPGSSIHGIFQEEYWSRVPLPSPMINLDSVLKNRDTILLTKVRVIHATVFPVVMYGCES